MAKSKQNVRALESISPYLFTSSTFKSSAASSHKDQQQAAHCPICLMKFKEPRRLQCDHTFCRSCLNSVFEQQQLERGENYCLICQQQVDVPPTGVDGLDSVIFVYSLKGILPRIKDTPSSLVRCSKCNGNRCLSCIRVVCNKCERYFASRICTICQTYMCGRCAQEHSTARTSHRTISIQEDVENKEKEIHDAQVALMNGGGLIVQQTMYEEEAEEPDAENDRSSQEGSNNEEEQIDPARLNQIVNERVHVEFGGQEIELIAPRNQRRLGRTSTTSSEADLYGSGPAIPKSCYELGGLRICTKLVAGFIASIILSTIIFGVLVLVAILPALNPTNSWLYPGKAVQVANIQPFWALQVTVSSDLPYNSSFLYESDFYYHKCSEIPTVSSRTIVNHAGIQDRNPQSLSVFLPLATNSNSLYLLSGSQMNFSILLYAETTYKTCASNLILYSNYDDYLEEDSVNVAFTHCVEHTTTPTGSPTTFSHTVSSPGFYFLILSIPPLTNYSIQISTEHMTYNLLMNNTGTNLPNSCQLIFTEGTRREECRISLTEDAIVVSDDHYCIVAVTTPLLSDVAPSFVKLTVSTSPNIFRNIAFVLTIIPVLCYFPVCFFLFLGFKCTKHCLRQCTSEGNNREITTI